MLLLLKVDENRQNQKTKNHVFKFFVIVCYLSTKHIVVLVLVELSSLLQAIARDERETDASLLVCVFVITGLKFKYVAGYF